MTFNNKCYKIISQIPEGKIATYKQIAEILNTRAYRAVGNALAKNRFPIIIPCHRIIKNNGEIGGYALGVNKKISLLKNEGIKIKGYEIVDYEKYLHSFNQTF